MYLVLFFIFAGLCVAAAINLLLQRQPINSALSLIVVMTSLAVLYLLLGAEFLAAAQVIVYSGAIMVLFTFVIMLLNASSEERTLGTARTAYIVGVPGVAALLGLLTYVFLENRTALGGSRLGDSLMTTADLSRVLFRDLLLPFEVTSVLILIAILGAVALAGRQGGADPVKAALDRPLTAPSAVFGANQPLPGGPQQATPGDTLGQPYLGKEPYPGKELQA
ncbi:MAG TPA: NADH-quinone oxidoreductase subunit J [Acidobacteriaceae bacterium]